MAEPKPISEMMVNKQKAMEKVRAALEKKRKEGVVSTETGTGKVAMTELQKELAKDKVTRSGQPVK